MGEPDFIRARAYACERLAHELSPNLIYHSLAHTRDDVVPAALRLAGAADVIGEDLLLLETAAWFHDIGFVMQWEEHEAAGVRIVADTLPGMEYSAAQIDAISGMIRATRMPQTPQTHLEEILADADLDSLGRADFLETSLALRAELSALGNPTTEGEWYARQLRFLQEHRYFTQAAQALRDRQKQQNIAVLHRRLADLMGTATAS